MGPSKSGPRKGMDADALCVGAVCSHDKGHHQAPPSPLTDRQHRPHPSFRVGMLPYVF